jgi:EmrB/QacA subfamily drug resistance transporter
VADALPLPRRQTAAYIALALLCSVQMMLFLDDTVVNVALPAIGRSLNMSEAGLTWIVNGYLLVFGGFLLLGGRCADVFGGKRVFMVGVTIFVISSLLTGLAQNVPMVLTSRGFQGLGGALASPAALSMVAGLFGDPKERSRALGIWAGLGGVAATMGVLISGLLTEYASWRWCFLINVPVGVIAFIFVPRLVPTSTARARGRIDGLGAALVTGGVGCIDFGLVDSSHASGLVTGLRVGIGVVLLIGFVIAEFRQRNPLIPLTFFRDRNRSVANISNILFCSANLSMLFFLTLYLQEVMHYSPARTGVAWLPFCAAVFLGFGTAAGTASRIGVRPLLMAAVGIGAVGMYLLSRLTVHGDYLSLLPGLLVAGLGMGLGFVSITIAAVGETHEDITGLASGLVTSTQQLGGALGLGVISALAIRHSSQLAGSTSQAAALTDGFHLAFIVCCCVLAAATVIVALGVTRNAGIAAEVPKDEDADASHLSTATGISGPQ